MRTRNALAAFLLLATRCSDAPDLPCAPADPFVAHAAVAGLSAVETFPATPEHVTLAPNPPLVDGDTTASAGIQLGWAPAAAGDSAPRDVGVELTAGAAVDQIRVWVDRALPLEVSSAYAWSAYSSEDDVAWTPIALTGPAQFGAVAARFEIPITRTQARYLKAVARPLPAGFSIGQPAFASVLVTEVQATQRSATCAAP